MSSELSLKEKLALIARHEECELRADWEGCLATMAEEPVYYLYPSGLRVAGRDAVVEQWRRLVANPGFGGAVTSAERTYWPAGDAVITGFHWRLEGDDGAVRSLNSYALFRFAGALIESETILADGETAAMISATLGEDFAHLPGVEQLPSPAPE